MKRLLTIICTMAIGLNLVVAVFAGPPFIIAPQGTTIPFNVQTLGSTGTMTTADNSPAWSIRDWGVSTAAIATGTYAIGTDSLGAFGMYGATLNLNSSTYTVGHTYTIHSIGTVAGVVSREVTAYVYVTGGTLMTAGTGSNQLATSSSGVLLSTASITTSINGAANITSGKFNPGTMTITNGLSAATFNITGAATFGSIRDGGSFTVAGFVDSGSFSVGTLAISALTLANVATLSNLSIGTVINGSSSDSSGVTTLLNRIGGTITINGNGGVKVSSGTIDSTGAATLDATEGSKLDQIWKRSGAR
jgi:hypothetical protein